MALRLLFILSQFKLTLEVLVAGPLSIKFWIVFFDYAIQYTKNCVMYAVLILALDQ